MATPQKQLSFSGYNIFSDEHGRTVMYDYIAKQGYLLQESDRKLFTLYHNRYFLVIIGLILAVSLGWTPWICLVVALAAAIWLEIRYRTSWLPSLTCLSRFKPSKRRSQLDALTADGEKGRCLVLCLAYAAFGILLVLNAYSVKAAWYIVAGCYAVMAFALYQSAVYGIAAFRIRRR